MGIQSKLKPVPSIVLGVNAVSPLDLATAYATLADGGVAHDPTILTKVVFPDGHTERASQPKGKQIVDPKVAAAVTKVLEANVQSGTGTAAALSGRPVAGKTGTTDSFADAWFAGWVPQLTTVTWVGYPTGERPMRGVHGIPGVTGGTLPAEIWHTFMTGALQGQPVEQFATPGAPPYERWCGRYQFARTWHDARKHDRCTHKHKKHEKKDKTTTQRKTTTAKTTTAPSTTITIPTTTSLPPTTTKKKPPPPPPTTTTTTTTTTPTTTTTRGALTRGACAGGAWRPRLPHRGARLGRLLPPEHLVPPVVLVDVRRDDLRPAGPPRHRHPTLLGELLEHGGAQGVQPLVLRCDLTGQVPALGLPALYVVLDLEQAVPVGEAFLNRAGHAALLFTRCATQDAAVVLAQSSSEAASRSIPRTSVSDRVRCIQVRCF